MKPTRQLHELGQSLWIDHISRDALRSGAIARLIEEDSVTGLTSNPAIFEKVMAEGDAYDDAIARMATAGRPTEDLFFALAVEDLQQAADLFAPVHAATQGADGWVSLEVSPLLADDTQGTVQVAASLHVQAARTNLFIKIPGTPAGIGAIEESIYRGIPVNVTLLFSPQQAMAAAEACLKGIERRLNDGKSPAVDSVLSLFVSRWDAAVNDSVAPAQRNTLGIAIARLAYKAWRGMLASERWKKLAAAGARAPRLLWASTGTKDPDASPTLYVEALAAPDTIDTMPEKTLRAFASQGRVGATLPEDGGDAAQVLESFRAQGVDIDALALRLQKEGGEAFAKSWHSLIGGLEEKVTRLTTTSPS